MVNNEQVLKELKILGLNEKEAGVYIVLLQEGSISPLQMSIKTEINRTTVYRILEKLNIIGLSEKIVGHKSTKYQAVSPNNIELIITKKEAELEYLKEKTPNLISALSQIKNVSSQPTQVIYFKGKEGLEQLLWNTLKVEGEKEIVGYGYLNWNESIGEKTANKLRQEYIDRNIRSREIRNQTSSDFSKIPSYIGVNWVGRYIPKSKLEIFHDTYIYDNVFAYYHFFNKEFFGIEIHNEEIAKTQKQIFEILWGLAKKI